MDALSSNIEVRPDSSVTDHRAFVTIRSPLPVTRISEEYSTADEGYPYFGGCEASCRAAVLSKRGLFLDGLRGMLGKSRISVIGEADNIPALLDTMQTRPVPELVICHIAFDHDPETALNLISGLRQHFARAKLVVLADACTTSVMSSIVRGDVSVILLTRVSSDMVLRSLELVLSGHCLFPSEIMPLITSSAQVMPAETVIRDHTQHDQAVLSNVPTSSPQLRVPLSKRECQIMDCLVMGWPNKRIAHELNIVEGTVKVYLKCLSRKIKVSNRTQLAIWALRRPRPFDVDDLVGSLGFAAD
jgi:two-component system, NarL family, nitrate/nitrite response regulator NarL